MRKPIKIIKLMLPKNPKEKLGKPDWRTAKAYDFWRIKKANEYAQSLQAVMNPASTVYVNINS